MSTSHKEEISELYSKSTNYNSKTFKSLQSQLHPK